MTATVAGIHLGLDTHANRPAANTVPDGSIYSCSTHGLIYKSNFAGNSWATWANLAGTGFADPMTTAGDFIFRNGSNITDRLPKGNAGGVVAMSNGAPIWNAGTSFPGSPATGDRYFRTNIQGGMECIYDGTRWRSAEIFQQQFQFGGITVNTSSASIGLWQPTYDVYVLEVRGFTYVVTTNTGAAFWTCQLRKFSDDSSIGTFSTSADSANTPVGHVGSVAAVSTEKGIYANFTKTGAPGTLFAGIVATYQLILT